MSRRPWWRSRWWTPAVALLLGGLILAATAAGGNGTDGLKAFAVMAVVAGAFAFGGRSETMRGLGGPGRDERWAMIDQRATSFAGTVVVTVLIGAWLWELAEGDDGGAYAQILVVGAIAYVLAIAFLRWRT